MRLSVRFLVVALLLLMFGAASAERTDIEKLRKVLDKEIKFAKFDQISLKPNESCPDWVSKELIGATCRRLDVVYRGVYLSGLLMNSGLPTEKLTIYHVGHEAGDKPFDVSRKLLPEIIGVDAPWLINQFLSARNDVLMLFMPGMGFIPASDLSRETKRLHNMLSQHSVFSLLDFDGDSAAAYFIAHEKGFLDKFGSSYHNISMVGRSGGGWATTLAAAVDLRVQCSISIFGSLPMKVRLPVEGDERNDMGDFEQHGLLLFKKIDYIDLYALAASPNRRHSLILNDKDDCCFSGRIKGGMMWSLFLKNYPTLSGFRWFNIPERREGAHFSMDRMVFSAAKRACPNSWVER